jgi:hypothetical protein
VDLPQQKRGVVQQTAAEKTPPLGQTPPSEAAPPPIPPRQSLLSAATGGNKAGENVENVTKKEPPSAGFQTNFGCFASSNGEEDGKGGGQEIGGSRHGEKVLDLSGASRELSQFMLLVGENTGETEKGSETVAKPPKMPHPPSSSCDEGVTTRKGSGVCAAPKKKHIGRSTEGGTTSIIAPPPGERELFDDFMCMDFSSRQQPTQKGQTKE